MKVQTLGVVMATVLLLLLGGLAVQAQELGWNGSGPPTEDLILCCHQTIDFSVLGAATAFVPLNECLAGPATPDAVNSCDGAVAKCESFFCRPGKYSMEVWAGSWKGVPKDCECLEQLSPPKS
jgi:hypothetical protein